MAYTSCLVAAKNYLDVFTDLLFFSEWDSDMATLLLLIHLLPPPPGGKRAAKISAVDAASRLVVYHKVLRPLYYIPLRILSFDMSVYALALMECNRNAFFLCSCFLSPCSHATALMNIFGKEKGDSRTSLLWVDLLARSTTST